MGVESKHPLYTEFNQDWAQLRDTYRGERIVKERGHAYLPPTAGMLADGALNGTSSSGAKAYDAYRGRARFPELVRQAVETMLGVMHHKPPTIELPKKLEAMLERATLRNESLQMLLRRINEEQLITGRLGLLLEVPDSPGPVLPYIALYQAEHIINWDDGARGNAELNSLNLVVLDESQEERINSFEWEDVKKYRVLVLGDINENEAQGTGVYSVGVFKDDGTFSQDALLEPSISGTTMDRVPFSFININDVVPTPDDAPLLGVSNLSLTIYRTEADYRQALFMQGQDTLVTIGALRGEGEAVRVGAGATIDLPLDGDAKFIGVSSEGLSELRSALENDYTRGEQRANGLLETVSRSAESGEALRVRVSARTASLNQIALTGAFGLQEILRMAATWVGADPEEVIVTPNLDFVADRLPAAELTGYMASKGLGAPISLQSIHEQMQDRGLTSLTWEEELVRLQEEADAGLPGAIAAGTEDDAGVTEAGSPEKGMGEDDKGDEDADEQDAKDEANGENEEE